jgi:hypothetical protein
LNHDGRSLFHDGDPVEWKLKDRPCPCESDQD